MTLCRARSRQRIAATPRKILASTFHPIDNATVTDSFHSRLARLDRQRDLLTQTLRGIEKEGLRVDANGVLAQTPHPAGLGAALTNEKITTDYSEALLELITGTHRDVDALLDELRSTHRYVYGKLGRELIWNQSMPAQLPPEPEIPIAWYGTSNTGMLKHVYRRGLAERYGKRMQCIAGLHYNFSLPDAIWNELGVPGETLQDQRSAGYIALIRNFTRYAWLLMYLFGAAPALDRRFLDGNGGLETFDADTLYLPYATSLRMSDLGYQSEAQSQLKLCYNDLDTFLGRIYGAVTQPWPEYEAIGTHRDGEWIQLNTNVLQIENEYYSIIRPKRATGRCERPVTAMAERGVQYIEVRCLDIDPHEAIGVAAHTSRFVDAFLLYCATADSPLFPANGYCTRSEDNFATIVKAGRTPGLMLDRDGVSISREAWATELLAGIAACADVLDRAYGGEHYAQAVAAQHVKVDNPDATPSARVLAGMRESGLSFNAYTLAQSQAHADTLRQTPLSGALLAEYEAGVAASIEAQRALEANDDIDFDTYVARYREALKAPPGFVRASSTLA